MTANAEHTHVETDVSAQRIGHVYAEALLNAAEKQNQAAQIGAELDSLVADVFRNRPEIEQFLASAALGRHAKSKILNSVFGSRASELVARFLQVLNDHDRIELIRVVRNEYHDELDRRSNRLQVLVRSAVPLSDDQRSRLSDEVRALYHQEPILNASVDADLLGGIVVRVGDQQYDGSVRTRIEAIGNQLIERSSHEIQSGRDRFSS
jgi:F-type H+-transporting ATPase subunit delta